MSRAACPLFLALLVCTLAAGPAASRSWAVTPTPVETPTLGPSTMGIQTPLPKWTSPEARLLEHEWWNQPDVIKAIELKDSQRTQMDELLKQALDVQRAAQQKQREGRIAFEAAVNSGDWDTARQAVQTLRAATAEQMGGQDDLKLAVLPLLDEAQRQKLASQYGYLLRRPWIVGVPMAGGVHLRGGGPGSTPQPSP